MLPNVEIDSLMPNESWPIESCDKGWEYNKTDVQSSIVIDVSLTPFSSFSYYPIRLCFYIEKILVKIFKIFHRHSHRLKIVRKEFF